MIGKTRQQIDLCLFYKKDIAGEAGGIVSNTGSGVNFVGYLPNIDLETTPVGIQLNNVEELDLSRQYHPALDRRVRRVDRPGAIVGISRNGIFDTNFIHPGARPYSGKKAYLAPSGLITDDASLGGPQVGVFQSDLDGDVPGLSKGSQLITVYGGGFFRREVFVKKPGQEPYMEMRGAESVQILSPGWARIRIKIT